MTFWMLHGKEIVSTTSVEEWLKYRSSHKIDRIGHTFLDSQGNIKKISDGSSNDCVVSTVFLGIDHGFREARPVLFETMVFNGPLHDEMERYCTFDEAARGHEEMVRRVVAEFKSRT